MTIRIIFTAYNCKIRISLFYNEEWIKHNNGLNTMLKIISTSSSFNRNYAETKYKYDKSEMNNNLLVLKNLRKLIDISYRSRNIYEIQYDL